MKLLIDMGNSRLKSAVLGVEGELAQFVFDAYGDRKPIDTLASHIDRYEQIDSVTLVSVLGANFYSGVVSLFEDRAIPLCWAASEQQAHGVTNLYNPPRQLGSDRFVALVAARQIFPDQACIVVDCGTAVTVDALTAQGDFCGGVIIPGLRLWSDSLINRAGQLNEHQIDDTELFAKDTAQAIGSGSLYGLTGAIEGICSRMSEQLKRSAQTNAEPKLIICGGDSQLITEYSQLKFELMPHLVLIGLAEYT